ncbi:MAG: DUF4367 domain-containing protein [Euryarchaeota archaeon]|nr:DUF4367 domain-containing protein [Euryarchaeota archaeon]
MKKIIVLVSVFALLMITISGCVGNNPAVNGADTENPETNSISYEGASGISTLKSLPEGFEYIATIPLSIEETKSDYKAENVSGILNVSEGIYKDSNNTEYHIDVIELEDKEAANNFITAYKNSFPPLSNGPRFMDVSFNGHTAVKITKYITAGGKSVPRYYYIWSYENYVIVVFGNTEEEALIKKVAEATGY